MSRFLRWIPIACLLLLASAPEVDAQRSWPNDVSGRPAPPCTIYNPSTNTVSFCSSTAPIPVVTAGGGTASTNTGAVTGFGKQWFFSNYQTFLNSNGGQTGGRTASVFSDDSTIASFHRNVGGGNVLDVAISTDGGVNFLDFNTGFVVGNDVQGAFVVPSTPQRFVVAAGASQIFTSQALLSGWAQSTYSGVGATPGGGVHGFAAKADGSRVLSTASLSPGTEVCISTNQGQSFGTCTSIATSTNPLAIAYAGGTTWLVFDTNFRIFQSTNDGVTWSAIQVLASGASTNGNDLVCLTPLFTTCVAAVQGQISVSTNAGATWLVTASLGQGTAALCDYGANNVAFFGFPGSGTPSSTFQNAFTSANAGTTWFPGQTLGTTWNGAGSPSLSSLVCRAGRGYVNGVVSTNTQFSWYNPTSAPGGTGFSSAGGFTPAALIQGGILLNQTQTSAATTAQTITFTPAPGHRVTIRSMALFSSTASQNLTLVIQSPTGTTLYNLGTVSTTATAGNPLQFTGSPLFTGDTGVTVSVVVGAAAAGTTTLSVVADQ
jgi:hypothetical protein